MPMLVKALLGEDAARTILPWVLIVVGSLLAAFCAWGVVLARRESLHREPLWKGLTFLAFAVALAVTGIWLLLRPDPRSEEERASAAIKRLKGEVTVDEKAPGRPVVKVSFRESQGPSRLSDTDLAILKPHLEALPQLRDLDLCRTDITDRGLSAVRGLTRLKTLILGSQLFPTRLTESGVNEIRKALPNTEVYFYTAANPGGELEVLKQLRKAP